MATRSGSAFPVVKGPTFGLPASTHPRRLSPSDGPRAAGLPPYASERGRRLFVLTHNVLSGSLNGQVRGDESFLVVIPVAVAY